MRRALVLSGGLLVVLGIVAACHAYSNPISSTSLCCGLPCQATTAVNDVLEKLEALKKQKNAIEQQEKALVAQLHQHLNVQQDRIERLGITLPSTPIPSSPIPSFPPAPVQAHGENSYYEPVTTYKTIRYFDPETKTWKTIAQPQTHYQIRPISRPSSSCTPVAPPASENVPPPMPSVQRVVN